MRAAAVQLNSTDDTDRNLETADRLVRAAAARGAQLIVLPEKWSVLGTNRQIADGAEPLDGRCITWARDAARELGVDLVAGLNRRARAGARDARSTPASTSGPTGSCARCTASCICSTSRSTASGTSSPSTSRPGPRRSCQPWPETSRSGLSICYDVRFPELYRMLSERGAEVITVPSAFTLATTRDHWEVLLRARAIENQCFVVAPNQIGPHPPGHRAGGRSLIVDPWGLILAGAPDTETVIVADLDFDVLRDVRKRLPALTHRRPDVYGWTP